MIEVSGRYEGVDFSGQTLSLTGQCVFDTCLLAGAKIIPNGFGYEVLNIVDGVGEVIEQPS